MQNTERETQNGRRKQDKKIAIDRNMWGVMARNALTNNRNRLWWKTCYPVFYNIGVSIMHEKIRGKLHKSVEPVAFFQGIDAFFQE
jgi:hypothetical protein